MKSKATKRAMAMAMRVATDNKGNGDGDKESRRGAAMRVMAAATTVVGKDEGGGMAMRVAGNKEGEVFMALVTVKRMAGKQPQRQERGQWR